MSATPATVAAGLADPVHDGQRAFRAALDALARPGRPVVLGQPVVGLPLGPALAHLLLALTDDGTPVWWQDGAEAAAWLRFHTGAPAAAAPRDAAFACVLRPHEMPTLEAFAQGTPAAPESSTTLLVEVPSLTDGPALQWHGPGIREAVTVGIAGLAPAFWAQWQDNHAAFPQGVDILFTCGRAAIGLPRTTRISRLAEV